jgi:ABC-2 type transport system ATP-binding protein
MSNAICTTNLIKKFGKLKALSELNLNVPRGAIYALVGPNGAGKTTAIKVLMNICPPTSGRVEILGHASTDLCGEALTKIGYVSENQELPEWMTIGALLSYLKPFYPQWDTRLEKQLVSQFELPLDRKLKQLSRGMRMKASLVSALAYHPELIILDEPFTGLDPLVRDELIEGLLEQASETTILISSHDLGEIESFASHVGYMEQGRLLFSEEMTTLTERFREVELTLPGPLPLPKNLPNSWLRPEISGSVVQFIASGFRGEETASEIKDIFPLVGNITFTAMSLRSIFLAMAKVERSMKQNEA